MTNAHFPYSPISCELHDRLEDLATERRFASILFRDESDVEQKRNARVNDVFSASGEEFVLISTGELLRLDRLIEVDGTRFVDPEASSLTVCDTPSHSAQPTPWQIQND